LAQNVNTGDNAALKFGVTITPGIAMTPVASILEASNAGHMNPEPLWKRATRGMGARCGREILFGVGINQVGWMRMRIL
jgi:hypothetical protein